MRIGGSTRRLMAAIALIAAALAVARSGDASGLFLGELTTMAVATLVAAALGLLASGAWRRFWVGSGITCSVLGLALWLAPDTWRSAILHSILLPLDSRFNRRTVVWTGPYSSTIIYNVSPLAVALEQDEYGYLRGPRTFSRHPFDLLATQTALGYLLLPLAIVGGLISAACRPRVQGPRPSTPSDDHEPGRDA